VVVADAKRTLERRKELHKRGAMSENEMDSAQAAYDQVIAQLKSAGAQEQAGHFLSPPRRPLSKWPGPRLTTPSSR
jgi:multidrug resistance efflux pump